MKEPFVYDANRWQARLDHVIDAALNVDSSTLPLLVTITKAAVRYWEYTNDTSDFTLQLVSDDCVIFGGTNRLVWSPFYGFRPDRAYCTERFLSHYEKLGPVPGVKL